MLHLPPKKNPRLFVKTFLAIKLFLILILILILILCSEPFSMHPHTTVNAEAPRCAEPVAEAT